MVWLGQTGQVTDLAEALEAACEPLGFAPEGRAFKAHLTLGRLRCQREPTRSSQLLTRELADLGNFEGPNFLGRRVALMQSTIIPRGPIYQPLAEWELGG
ncbi:RNA 2',3'-cyclic 3'-phosphodiesterase [Desulfarculales bacterium]